MCQGQRSQAGFQGAVERSELVKRAETIIQWRESHWHMIIHWKLLPFEIIICQWITIGVHHYISIGNHWNMLEYLTPSNPGFFSKSTARRMRDLHSNHQGKPLELISRLVVDSFEGHRFQRPDVGRLQSSTQSGDPPQ